MHTKDNTTRLIQLPPKWMDPSQYAPSEVQQKLQSSKIATLTLRPNLMPASQTLSPFLTTTTAKVFNNLCDKPKLSRQPKTKKKWIIAMTSISILNRLSTPFTKVSIFILCLMCVYQSKETSTKSCFQSIMITSKVNWDSLKELRLKASKKRQKKT